MADQPPLVSLTAARERTVQDLSAAFASDDLTVDELERRIELAYKATSLAALNSLTADLRGPVPQPIDATLPVAPHATTLEAPLHYDRIVAVMSESKRHGLWAVPQRLDLVSIMSDSTIDFSNATLPAGIIDIKVRALMTSLKIILPPGVRVASRVHNVMSSVMTDDAADASPAAANGPVIRLKGWATMAELRVMVRRRDDPRLT